MTWDTARCLTATEAMVAPLVGAVDIGPPQSESARLAAFLGLAGGPAGDVATGSLIQQTVRVRVTFWYRTDGDVRTAELELATAYDNLKRAFYSARNASADTDPLHAASLDPSIAAASEYELVAAQEFRRFPIDIVFVQRETVAYGG